MNCRLCNAKIPRIRALFKKSEFCCDEHAEQYKDQTLDRLLAEQEQAADAVAPLPVAPTDEHRLSSLESRTPLLDGQTVQGGPRRLPPPNPPPPPSGGSSGFGGLLDRLPAKKPSSEPAGNIGGWDQAGGEDPLEALMRLEGADAPKSQGFGPAKAIPSGFDAPLSGESSSEDDAISALRRLAQEARQSAQPKQPLQTDPDAGAEDPFARLAAGNWPTETPPAREDHWASADALTISPGGPDEEKQFEEFDTDQLASHEADPETEISDGLSMFDRLVRDFESDPHDGAEADLTGAGTSLPAPFHADASEQAVPEASPVGEDEPFAGSVFDRLMADPPKPKPAKPLESVEPAAGSQDPWSTDAGAEPWTEHPEELPEEAAVEQDATEAGEAEREALPSEEDASTEDADQTIGPVAASARPEPARTVSGKRRKAAPIEPKTDPLDLQPEGWPNLGQLEADPECAERVFAEQRRSEAALHTPPLPDLIEPAWVGRPDWAGSPARRSGGMDKAENIPWGERILPAEIAVPVNGLEQPSLKPPSANGARQPLYAAPPLQMPGAAEKKHDLQERLPANAFAGRLLEIDSTEPAEMPSANVALPPLDCLRANGRAAAPPTLSVRNAANGGFTTDYSPQLDLSDALPVPDLLGEGAPSNFSVAAIPPAVPVCLPGDERNGDLTSPTPALSGVVAWLAGAEPRGCSFDAADLNQMRRLVAEQTTTVVGQNGNFGPGWSPSIASEPFQPALGLENGGRP